MLSICEEDLVEDLEVFSFTEQAPIEPLLIWLLHFPALLQKKHFLPDAALNLLLHFLYIVFKVLYRLSPHNQLARIVDDFLLQCINFINYYMHKTNCFSSMLFVNGATQFTSLTIALRKLALERWLGYAKLVFQIEKGHVMESL